MANQSEQIMAYQRYLASFPGLRNPLTYGQWLARQQRYQS